ncbi:MAG: glycosyltransferase family 2 protein [Streptosporangiaceae bacterium]
MRGGSAIDTDAEVPERTPERQGAESVIAADPDARRDMVRDLISLADGSIRTIEDIGPVLAPRPTPRRRLSARTLAMALSRRDRFVVAVLSLAWAVSVAVFWMWWLEPVHRAGLLGLLLNSAVLAYVSLFPFFFVVGANRLRRLSPEVTVPDLRVAFVVTRAPSEPWELAKTTLRAMLTQRFPLEYDVWLCDERPDEAVLAWCALNGVKVSTRNGVASYHRATWPRRTKCKEGNLAYFYDHWGYRDYDVVAQLDCDHEPSPTYLAEMVRGFADPAVGYVAAPSVCDSNGAESWSARGRVYREATFHGPFQLGHTNGLAPLCIGSHYAVRTSALRQIGGVGPELAEDFSTTFLLNAAGWQGVFAIDAEAHGDGPETFAAMIVQEFQWSRSLTSILLGLMPKNVARLPWLLRVRFGYALSYYVLLALTTIVGLAMAPIAAATGISWVAVNYLAFLGHWWPIALWLVLIIVLLRRRGLLRPVTAPVISWESALYALTRWPYVAWGISAAVWQRIRPRPVTFKVTPKRDAGLQALPVRLIAPYLAISLASAGAALIGESYTTAVGYVFLCLMAALTYAVVLFVVPILHASEAASRTGSGLAAALWQTARMPVALATIALLTALLAAAAYPVYAAPLLGL